MVQIIPYLLIISGKDAIEYYRAVFNAKLLVHQPFTKEILKSMEVDSRCSIEDSTMHAVMEIAGSKIYLADNNQNTQDYGHVEIAIECDDEDQIQQFYHNATAAGSIVKLALQDYSWGWYARIIDPFGIGWQLNFNN